LRVFCTQNDHPFGVMSSKSPPNPLSLFILALPLFNPDVPDYIMKAQYVRNVRSRVVYNGTNIGKYL
ncbi:MAG: hypothetical protein ACOCW1_02485, partial [Chitinispirillaceae bacterium]